MRTSVRSVAHVDASMRETIKRAQGKSACSVNSWTALMHLEIATRFINGRNLLKAQSQKEEKIHFHILKNP